MADSHLVRPKNDQKTKLPKKNNQSVGQMWLGILPDLLLFYQTCPVGPTLLGKTGRSIQRHFFSKSSKQVKCTWRHLINGYKARYVQQQTRDIHPCCCNAGPESKPLAQLYNDADYTADVRRFIVLGNQGKRRFMLCQMKSVNRRCPAQHRIEPHSH